MTEAQMIVRIAEACKWVDVRINRINMIVGRLPSSLRPEMEYDCPDYCRDLNAIQGACFFLSNDQRVEFINQLCNIVALEGDGPHSSLCKAFYATAKQRAEAFLKTIGKWEE